MIDLSRFFLLLPAVQHTPTPRTLPPGCTGGVAPQPGGPTSH
jgi:hypothetical protein